MAIPRIDDLDPRIAESLGYLGKTPAWTCVADNRFCYFLYVPRNYHTREQVELIVLIHHSDRNASEIRTHFAPFADKHACIILAPLFPIRADDPQDSQGYKQLASGDVRYDQIVLSMVDEVKARFSRARVDRFYLYGFSGGAQFVHRFAYLYPARLKALACGAPGSQTLPDDSLPYPAGVKDLEQVFGVAMQWEQVRAVPTIFIVGEADTDTFYLTARGRTLDPSIQNGRLGATTRLSESWLAAGANCHLQTVPGRSTWRLRFWTMSCRFSRSAGSSNLEAWSGVMRLFNARKIRYEGVLVVRIGAYWRENKMNDIPLWLVCVIYLLIRQLVYLVSALQSHSPWCMFFCGRILKSTNLPTRLRI
ncbi:uncharacterized protein N7459_004762 [Penicillium hispanicum]|uniref:uncharacterized protein n=1 Tax=Penicillium hispanicum TaxID=1080232 RepID=UPI00253FD8CD|nr:uncharacterized protein N7459_004762 [Penicillium hispanicum]KAJ5584962.1 hypothetical protein N7459_004762 [Penicillium hispanicum]